jgi:hypothetical protein
LARIAYVRALARDLSPVCMAAALRSTSVHNIQEYMRHRR